MLSRRIHDEKMEAQGRATQEVKNAAETLAERHNEIVRFLRLIHQSGDVFEVRALDCGNYSQVHAGFFDDFDKAASEILRADKFLSPRGIYHPTVTAVPASTRSVVPPL